MMLRLEAIIHMHQCKVAIVGIERFLRQSQPKEGIFKTWAASLFGWGGEGLGGLGKFQDFRNALVCSIQLADITFPSASEIYKT